MRLKSNLKKVILATLLVTVLYLIMVLTLQTVGIENAQNFIKQAGVLAPIVFIALCAASLVIAPLSGSSLFIIGGALFGKQTAFLLSFIATLLGCSANFWISRKLGRKVAERLIGKTNLDELDKFANRLKNRRGILYMILILALSQDIVSYAIGLTRIKYTQFLISLIISSTVIVSAYVYIGSSLLGVLIQTN